MTFFPFHLFFKPWWERYRSNLAKQFNHFNSPMVYKFMQVTASELILTAWFPAMHWIYFRAVYHCPFCNLCRVGTGLGADFFHCMKCNCCLAMKLADHKCREKGLETNCPICCDDMFTSSASVKALPCGHFMHSTCFQVYFLLVLSGYCRSFLFQLFACCSDMVSTFFLCAWYLILFALHCVRRTLVVTTSAQFAANLWETCR